MQREDEPRLAAHTPLYLLAGETSCWKCGSDQVVIALAVADAQDEDGWINADHSEEDPEPILLCDITAMPDDVAAYLRAEHPRFGMRFSKTAGHSYYANTCKCGAIFGEFYLSAEPGAVFFPTTRKEAARVRVAQLPFAGTLEFSASYSLGSITMIFEPEQGENEA